MATLYTHQKSNVQKTWALMTVFLVIVIIIGWLIGYSTGNPAIVYIAVVIALVMNVFSYWKSDKIALALSGAKPIDLANPEHKELDRLVENLAITAGLPKPRVYIINDPAPNAFATGRDKEHAAIAVTTGIVGMLEKVELEGVIAHELSHIGNRDILVQTVVVVLVGFIAILSDMFLRMGLGGGKREGKGGGAIMIVAIVAAILAPLAANLIKLAISRKREFLADASGALLTRYPEGLAGALLKIESYGEGMRKTSHATAHLFIASPFGSGKSKGAKSFFNRLFSTHPPTEDRVTALIGNNRNV